MSANINTKITNETLERRRNLKLNINSVKIAMARKMMNAPMLAKTMGVTKTTINSLLNGTRNPSLKMIGKLAKALEVDVTDIITQ